MYNCFICLDLSFPRTSNFVIHGYTSLYAKLVLSFILTTIKPGITENAVVKWHCVIYNPHLVYHYQIKLLKATKPSDFSFFYLVRHPNSTQKNHAC